MMDSGFGDAPQSAPGGPAVFFDGMSSRRRAVMVALKDWVEISENCQALTIWAYADVRRVDSPQGILRVTNVNAPPLARLEIRDAALAAELQSRCADIDTHLVGRRGVATIVGWSLAAAVSIVLVVLFGVPLAADRLAPLVPPAVERRIGEATDAQVRLMFGDKTCSNAAGQAAFAKLVRVLRETAGLDTSVQSAVLSTSVPNALALPGGKIYLLDGLLQKAENVDEIAGVLAHELGHLQHRDAMRGLIYNGGTSFLIGLLFGDITGSGALTFAARQLVTASYSREAEQNADTFSIEVMQQLGRSPKPVAELIFRVTGKEGKSGISILSSHPLTEDRLARMSREDRPPSGPPLLTAEEWQALKSICGSSPKL